MRTGVLRDLGLAGAVPQLVGSAVLARTAARHLLSAGAEGETVTDVAALSIGRFAILDAQVTARLCNGLAISLDERGTAQVPLYAALGAPDRFDQVVVRWQPPSDTAAPDARNTHIAFMLVARRLRDNGIPLALVVPEDDLDGIRDRMPRTRRSAPVGRMRIPLNRWLALDAESPRAVFTAALDIARRGADVISSAMADTYHWRGLHKHLAPVEPELLLAGMAFHVAARDSTYEGLRTELANDPALRAVLVAAADLLPDSEWPTAGRFAEEWGGEELMGQTDMGAAEQLWRAVVGGESRW